uniref:7TM_GPCR_Srx domain-containing protein n=1 Tax=Strongyloides stercoralis TaxID=6248 RepID=A0A0K0E7S1_STRER
MMKFYNNSLNPINNWTNTKIIISPGPYNILIGCTYLGITSCLIFLQIMTFITFYKKSNLMYKTPLKLMINLGVTEIIQQSMHFISSFYTIFLLPTESLLINFLASILQSAYIVSIAFVTLLTLNRFNVFYQQKWFPLINKEQFFTYGTVVLYVCFFLLIIFYMIPPFRLTFTLVNYGWLYSSQKNGWILAWEVENKTATVLLLFSFILYILIFCKVVYMRKTISNSFGLQLSDIRLLIQGIFNFLSIVFLEWGWRYLPTLVHDQSSCAIVLNYLFLLVSGNNTISGLILIKEIRKQIYGIFCYFFHKSKSTTNTSIKTFKKIVYVNGTTKSKS